MKLFKSVLVFIFINSLLFSQVSKYEEVSILGEKVYFPKQTSKYLSELLEDDDFESYYELAKTYSKLGEVESAKNFLVEYEKKSQNYIRVSELYNLVGDYVKEIEYIEKYLENPEKKSDKITYYEYIYKLIEDKGLDLNKDKYNVTKLDILRSYLEDEEKYYEYFLSNGWSESEKKEIINDLKNSRKKSVYIERVLSKVATIEELAEIYYNRIGSIDDFEGYYKYFALKEEKLEINDFRNEFEKLHYLNYKNDPTSDFFREKIAYELSEKGLEKELYKLYLIKSDFKLMYNLAFFNDKLFYEFIKKQQDREISAENIQGLLEIFSDKFPKSEYLKEILEMKLSYLENYEQKLELINSAIEKDYLVHLKYNDDLLLIKYKIMSDLDRESEVEDELRKIILSSYESEKLIKFYIEMLEKSEKIEELLMNLKKLNDKTYYLEEALQYSYEVDKKYEKNLINYYFSKGEYQNLIAYKDKLDYKMYDLLIKSGWNEFLETAISKYSLQKEWVDISKFKYFFFDENYNYLDEKIVTDIFGKIKRTDAEIYYLAKHYETIGELDKMNELMDQLQKTYILR